MNDQGQQANTGHLDLLEALPIMILDVDRDGKLLFANKKVKERLGLPADLEDITLADILDDESQGEAMKMLEELFAGESDITATWRVRPRDGAPILVDSNAVSIYENGYPIRVRTYLHDGSETVLAPPSQGTPGNAQLRDALKEEQEYTKALIQKSGMLVYILDTKNRVVEINKKMEDVTGFNRENAPTLEALLAGLYPETKYRGIVQRIHENMYKNQHIRETELSIATRSGEVKHISWSTARLKNARSQVHGFIAMGWEVSDKKRLNQLIKLQSSCFERVSDAVVVADLEGRIINWVGGSERMLGYTAKEMERKNLSELFPTEYRDEINTALMEGIKQDGKWSGEMTISTSDQHELAVRFESAQILNEKGSPIALVSVIRDQTKEKQVEQTLRETRTELEEIGQTLETREQELAEAQARIEEIERRVDYLGTKNRDIEQEANRLASGRVALEEAIKELSIYQLQIQNTTSAAIITLDTSGVILTWSSGAEELTKTEAKEAFNRHQDDMFKLEEFDWESLQAEAEEKGQVVVPCTLNRADGSRQAIVLEVSVLKDEENRPIGFAEVALCPLVPTDLEKDLLESKNLALVGALAGGIARDVGDAFAALNINTRRLKEYTDALKKVVELYRNGAQHRDIEDYVRRVDLGSVLSDLDFLFDESLEGLVRIRNLARDLNSYLPGSPDKQEPLNLNELAASAISLMETEVRNRARIESDFADPVLISINRNAGLRAILNLLLSGLNSFERADATNNEIWIRTALDGDHAVVEITHNGKALPSGISDNLSDFSYLATIGGLPYLALGMAHRLCTASGGSLTVESHAEGGAKFRATFVCAEVDPVSMPAEEEESVGSKARVLFVDDDKNQLRSYRRYFERYYEVFQANSVEETKNALEVRQDFDAVVLDLIMPEEAGLKLLEEISDQYPDLRDRLILLIPNGISETARETLLKSGSILLEKPTEMVSLKTVINATCPPPA